jgi:hypothetical protein
MFNLLGSGVAGAWEGTHLDMDLDRFNTYSGRYGEIVDAADPASLRQLEGSQALVMYEVGVDGPNATIVRHGRLRNVAKYGQVVSCQIELDAERPYLPREKIVDFAKHLDMHRFEQGRTHWAIKDGDLPPALLATAMQELPATPAPAAAESVGTLVGGLAVLPEGARVSALIVALENYRPADANQIESVAFAKADAEAFKAAVETIFAAQRPEIVMLTDGDATHASLVNEVKARTWGLGEDDLFILYYAGHGFHDETGNRLTVWDTTLTNVAGTTVCLDADLLAPLRASPCQRVLGFIDACAIRITPIGRKAVSPLDTAEFAKLLKTAAFNAVFLSCRAGQESYPDRDLGHGVWTYYLLRALNGAAPEAIDAGGYVTNATLQDYLRQEVPRHVANNPRIAGAQTPEVIVTATNTFAICRVQEQASPTPAPTTVAPPAKAAPEAARPSPWPSKEPYPGSSTSFFHDRFASAFPGVREPRWFTEAADIQRRLARLLAPPLTFANGQPFWWWSDGNLHIESFEHVGDRRYQMDVHELEITRIAAVPGRAYWGDFVYVEVAGMEPTGANPGTTPEDIARHVARRGYDDEEYGLYKGRTAISRAEYDDGAAEIGGELVDVTGQARLRVRYLTPYNFLIAANASPINNVEFDQHLPKLLRAILSDETKLDDLVEAVQHLPRRQR